MDLFSLDIGADLAKIAIVASAYRLTVRQGQRILLVHNVSLYTGLALYWRIEKRVSTPITAATGTATSTLISTAFVGVGTAFLSELGAGDTVYNGSSVLIGTILSVTNDTNAVLTANGAAAITGAAFRIVKANPRIQLIADRSGNSAVNGMVGNGVSGNYATYTALTAFGTGNFSFSIKIRQFATASPAVLSGGAVNSFVFFLNGTAITAGLNGVGDNTPASGTIALQTDAVLTYVKSGSTGTYYINGVAAGTTTDNRNYSAGISSLGARGAGDGTGALTGIVYWGRAYNVALTAQQVIDDAAGSVQSGAILNADFTVQAKIVASFTAAIGGTVTVNTTGDLGARISGARDRVQLTPARQRQLVTVGGFNRAVANGVNQYDKSAPFPLIQPTEIYYVGAQTTWTSGDYLFDGNAANTGAIIQTTTTPQLNLNAGASVAANTGLAVATQAVIYALFNGATSLLGINLKAETTGDASTGNMGGITVGSSATPGNYGDTTESEMIVRSVASDASLRAKIKGFLIRKWNIPMP